MGVQRFLYYTNVLNRAKCLICGLMLLKTETYSKDVSKIYLIYLIIRNNIKSQIGS